MWNMFDVKIKLKGYNYALGGKKLNITSAHSITYLSDYISTKTLS